MYLKLVVSFMALSFILCKIAAKPNHNFPTQSRIKRTPYNLNPAIPDESICGNSVYANEVRGYRSAFIGEFPWVARIQFEQTKGLFPCEGALINSRYVVTTGMCTTFKRFGNIVKIRLGDHNCQNNYIACKTEYIDVGPEEIITHRDYYIEEEHHIPNNIGLIRLDREIHYSDTVQPICLPKPEEAPLKVGELVIESGWFSNYRNSDDKILAEFYIVPLEDCIEFYKKRNASVLESNICAQGANNSLCATCTGGPLTQRRGSRKWYLEGILSFSSFICGNISFPSAYTDVRYYLDWIHTNVRN
ncbi:unnamed protein product [Psylliodes chrysocephalus]|uniref:Peptidase S1 domain-containing protein n=1 Tax=Psylliodes chrysocephalus TaxID=3402493 RepID=A0A9P0GAG3_9CUCU|nr:unnamed protein product [Psylliodes chrysocephala]